MDRLSQHDKPSTPVNYRRFGWQVMVRGYGSGNGNCNNWLTKPRPGKSPVCQNAPPGTSKWNKIEHRLYSLISQNCRGKPQNSHQVIIDLIAATTTKTGLTVKSKIDTNIYEPGLKVSDQQMAELQLRREKFHGDWNYKLLPRS